MSVNITNILKYLDKMNIDYKYVGKSDLDINGFSPINNTKSDSITWIKNEEILKQVSFNNMTNLLVVSAKFDNFENQNDNISFIFCDNPKETFFTILKEFFKQEEYKNYISPKSTVEGKLEGENIYIGHNCYVGKDVTIEDNVIIKHNVSIEGKVRIGKNTIIHSGVVIGADGYGYYQNSEGENRKVPHYGGVTIGQDVEIGANTCIDRGTLDDTYIGNNVKIDNLCHIAHNVEIQDNSSVIALSMLGGSVLLEKNSYVAPGAIIKNQITIGENSLVGLGAVVIKDVDKRKVVAGVPAKVIKEI